MNDEANPYCPVGTILGQGSTGLQMTATEWQIAELVALGAPYKKIARMVGISTTNVGVHVARIGKRIPGEGSPRIRLSAWMWVYGGTPTE